MLEKIGQEIIFFFENAAIPFEIIKTFDSIGAIWDAFPLALKAVLLGTFALAVFIVVVKMLF